MIHDEFTDLDISRQRKYQLRQELKACCVLCGKPSFGYSQCPACKEKAKNRKCALDVLEDGALKTD